MMLADTGTLAIPRGGKDFNALFAPYVFRDHGHFRAFIQSQTFRDMLAPVERDAGFKYVGYVSDRTPRQLTTANRKVLTPADMKGLKIRVPETPTILETMKAWGASPTPIPAAELYLAMKQGLVDGQDNGFDGQYVGYAVALLWCSDHRNNTWQEAMGLAPSLEEAVTALHRWLAGQEEIDAIQQTFPWMRQETSSP